MTRLRFFWALMLAGTVGAASGQDFGTVLNTANDALRAEGVITTPPIDRANRATSTPPPEGDTRQAAPGTQETADPNQFVLRNAQRASQKGDEIEAVGNVHFLYKGYEVMCEKAFGNLKTNVFVLEGQVRLLSEDKSVSGDRVQVDFNNETFGFLDARAVLAPKIVGPQLTSDLFVRAEVGGGDQKVIDLEDAHLTTCNNEHPHYDVVARRATIRVGRRAILRDVRLKVLGRTVLKIPYLVVPLEQYAERYVPEVGRTPDQGYYIKTRYSTPIRGEDWLGTSVDYFEKLGLGLGGDYHYTKRNAQGIPILDGVYELYALTKNFRTVQSALRHRQKLFGGDLFLDGNFQKNNYITAAPNTTTYSARGTYLLTRPGGTTQFNYFRTGSQTSLFSTNQDNFGINDNRQWTDKIRTDLNVNLTNQETRNTPPQGDPIFNATRQLDVQFSGTDEFNFGTGMLEYRRTIPVGHRQSFFAGDDRTPVLSLDTDARRLLGRRFSMTFPFRAKVSWGELTNTTDQSRITRTSFDLSFSRDPGRTGRHQFGFNGRFAQSLYSDDTAQYVLNGGVRYSYGFDRNSALNLRYNYLRPYGFTPLSSDRSGRTHLVSADLSYQRFRQWTLRAQTGYDILQLQQQRTPWQRISINSDFAPWDNMLLRAQSTYDTVQRVWQNVRLDFQWEVGGARISAGTNYDAQRHTWSNFNLYADGFQIGKLRFGMIFSYDGYNRQVQARHFSLTYDLHCVEAILQVLDNPVGFRSGREIYLFLRVKGLPFDTPFGVGNRGQAIGFGSGIRG